MHPNDVDRKRIERALDARKRYRYVSPQVRPSDSGYWIQSPCCSRNVDRDGGVIDIARLEYQANRRAWRLYRKDHTECEWLLVGEYLSLGTLLDVLNQDPERIFWQ